MSKPCFTNEVIERYGRTITRVQTQYKNIADQQRQNATDIKTLIKNLTRLTKAQDSDQSLRRGSKTLNDKTALQYAREVLTRAQRPLTPTEVLVRMEESGWMTTSQNKNLSVLILLSKNSQLFNRVERGKYILNRG